MQISFQICVGKHTYGSVSPSGAAGNDPSRVSQAPPRDDDDSKEYFFVGSPKTKKVPTVFQSEFPLFRVPPTIFSSRVEIYPPDSGEKDMIILVLFRALYLVDQ